MTTYRLADGDPVYGEYAFVTDTEYFNDRFDPVKVVQERWVLSKRVEMWLPEPCCIECGDPLPDYDGERLGCDKPECNE